MLHSGRGHAESQAQACDAETSARPASCDVMIGINRNVSEPTLRTSSALVAACLSLGSLVAAAPAPAAGAAAVCDGQPATHVGTPGQDRLNGTTGPDVIVSNGAKNVYAAEGEDLVCLTNGDAVVTLDGFNEYDNTFTWANDRVIGSGGDDRISSGAGVEDYFDINQATENGDVLSLGTGDSTVYMDGIPVGSIDGGSGRDQLFSRGRSDQLTVAVNTSMVYSGHPTADLDGIESFHLENASVDVLKFTGSSASEALYTNPGFSELGGQNPDAVTVALGGGDDVIALAAKVMGTIAGGQGDDQFRYTESAGAPQRVTLNLLKGAVAGTGLKAKVSSFSRLYTNFGNVTVVGDGQRNDVAVNACTVRVRSGAGDDRVAITTFANCDGMPHVLNGGAGQDQLIGGRGRDLLIGGPGRDRADGRARSDRCVAEIRSNCER